MKNIIRNLPTSSGVYQFFNSGDELLYVGKAKNLKKRVESYFSRQDITRPWIEIMKPQIARVEVITVKSETDALMLEASLISQFKPKFNIQLTDDKSYPYIRLSTQDEYPALQVIRQIKKDKARYFGPYLSARAARATCYYLRRVYGVHISNKKIIPSLKRPCFACQLDNNRCVLAGEIDQIEYTKKVKQAVSFLQGKGNHLINEIHAKMQESAVKEQFEKAAKWRDLLRYLKATQEPSTVVTDPQMNFDVLAIEKVDTLSVIALVFVRNGQVINFKYFDIQTYANLERNEVLEQFIITTYVNNLDIPSKVIVDGKLEQTSSIVKLLSLKANKNVSIVYRPRADLRQFLELTKRNAQNKLEQKLLKVGQTSHQLLELKKLLKLNKLPERIEAIDTSNLGASEAVGASICYYKGKPNKNEYRRYKIKTVKGQNDFAMIGEVVKRRLSDASRPLPDLLVIDGGKEQLTYAINAAGQLKDRVKIIALAKKPDRIFIENYHRPVSVSKRSPAICFLSQLRDEVHRFAISFQRARQRKRSLTD